jgi:hypothetical protein
VCPKNAVSEEARMSYLMPSSGKKKTPFHASFMRIRVVRKINDPPFPVWRRASHVHFPETQLYISRIINALLDLLEWGEEDHVDKSRASDTDSKACELISRCSWASVFE